MKICCCCCDKAKVDADVDTDARSEPLLAGKKSKNEVTFEEVAKITLESTQDEPKNVKMIRAYSRKGSVADMSIDSNDSSLSDLPDGIPSELEPNTSDSVGGIRIRSSILSKQASLSGLTGVASELEGDVSQEVGES